MADLEISCSDCGDTFPFRDTEQAFYRERNLTPPKRCRACRDKRKTATGGPGGGGDRAGGPPGRARAGSRSEGPPRRGGPPAGRGGPGGAGAGASAGPRGPRPPREDRPRPDPRDRKAPVAAGEAPRAQWGRPQPAFARADAPSGGGGGGGADKPRPPRAGRVFDAAPSKRPPRAAATATAAEGEAPGAPGGPGIAGAPRDPKNPRDGGRRAAAAAAVREEKPRFHITCQECGTEAEVPFKPIDGRQIFCQPCYRARKGTVAAATEGASIDSQDAGIVE